MAVSLYYYKTWVVDIFQCRDYIHCTPRSSLRVELVPFYHDQSCLTYMLYLYIFQWSPVILYRQKPSDIVEVTFKHSNIRTLEPHVPRLFDSCSLMGPISLH